MNLSMLLVRFIHFTKKPPGNRGPRSRV